MTRSDLLKSIDEAFESYADNREMSAENLRSRVRILINDFCDGVSNELRDLNDSMDEMRSDREGHDIFERGMAQKYPVRDRYGDVD